MAVRGDIRNVAIVAHVVTARPRWSMPCFSSPTCSTSVREVPDRVMDSNDLEREGHHHSRQEHRNGIHRPDMAAKYRLPDGISLNIIDTPARRFRRWSSAASPWSTLVLAGRRLEPAAAGPLRAAPRPWKPSCRSSQCVNKVDRPDARISGSSAEVPQPAARPGRRRAARRHQADLDQLLEMPVIYCAAKAGYASTNQPEDGGLPDNDNLEPLFRPSSPPFRLRNTKASRCRPCHNIDSSDFLGRLVLVRIYNGTWRRGQDLRPEPRGRSIENFPRLRAAARGSLERIRSRSAGPGDIVADLAL